MKALVGLALVGVMSGRAEADVSKAWAAAKANLPISTEAVLAIDIAEVVKSPLFLKVWDELLKIDRDFPMLASTIKTACKADAYALVDGIVIAGSEANDSGAVYVQLKLDRAKLLQCAQDGIAALTKGKAMVTAKMDGNYLVVTETKKSGRSESGWFPLLDDNVLVISTRPDKKDVVDSWHGRKDFAKSRVASMLDKLDSKAIAAGAFATFDGRTLDTDDLPVTKAYGNLTFAGGKLTGTVLGTATDAKGAKALAGKLNQELAKEMKRDRTPASLKKVMAAMAVAAQGNDVTIKGAITDKELATAVADVMGGGKNDDLKPQPPDNDEMVAKLAEFSNQMCACKDKACAQKVSERMTKWGAKNPTASKPSPETVKRATQHSEQLVKCMTKLMSP
jgi:hypothetical protein